MKEKDYAPQEHSDVVVQDKKGGFSRPRKTPLDEHEQRDEEPIIAPRESGYTRVRTARSDEHEQKDEEPIVSRMESAYTRKRTESKGAHEDGARRGASGEELDFSSPLNQIASKPPRRQK